MGVQKEEERLAMKMSESAMLAIMQGTNKKIDTSWILNSKWNQKAKGRIPPHTCKGK